MRCRRAVQSYRIWYGAYGRRAMLYQRLVRVEAYGNAPLGRMASLVSCIEPCSHGSVLASYGPILQEVKSAARTKSLKDAHGLFSPRSHQVPGR